MVCHVISLTQYSTELHEIILPSQKLFTDNREKLVHLLKGITVGTDKFQVTPIPQVCC
jgi:hypothetical protein